MSFSSEVSKLIEDGELRSFEPLAARAVDGLLDQADIRLPKQHLEWLKTTDGLDGYGGYFRLFGLDDSKAIDLVSWNSDDLWKFAWGEKLRTWLCFGENAWGDQYAYKLDASGALDSEAVYFVEGLCMEPEKICDSFNEFVSKDFCRNAHAPYDEMVIQARRRVGDISLGEHIAYIPSPLLGGAEDICNVQKLDAVASMVLNGDLYTQLAHELQDRQVKEIQPYEDANGRSRLKVVWLSH